MNKTELIDAIAEKSGLSKKASEDALKATLEAITEAVKKDDKVVLVGFGTLYAKERKAREGRNPATGKKIKIKASKSPAFKAGKSFKDQLN